MKTSDQQPQEEPKTNSLFGGNILEYYINNIARALIAFFVTMGLITFLRIVFNISIGLSIAIAIIIGLIISPLLSRIKVAKYIIVKYDEFLERQADKIIKWRSK